MAHTRTARKRIRQSARRSERNQAVKSRVRTLTKKFRHTLAGGESEKTPAALKDVVRALDKAAGKGTLHRRTASRKVSRLAKAAYRKATQSSPEAPAAS